MQPPAISAAPSLHPPEIISEMGEARVVYAVSREDSHRGRSHDRASAGDAGSAAPFTISIALDHGTARSPRHLPRLNCALYHVTSNIGRA